MFAELFGMFSQLFELLEELVELFELFAALFELFDELFGELVSNIPWASLHIHRTHHRAHKGCNYFHFHVRL